MYTPKHFEVRDPALLFALMDRFSFATLVSIDDGVPVASHLPFLIAPQRGAHGTLISHMARANTQWQTFTHDQEILTIFQGDHTYISPSWYTPQPAVPTWNYMVVHAYGVPHMIDDDAALDMLARVIDKHEAAFAEPWHMDDAYATKLLRGIVAFEIPITRLEGKFKLSQNRSERDQQQVIEALSASTDPIDRELAQAMRSLLHDA
jgi:transcriptional regulator